ncbi:MAG: TetR/AcrR family transcriptional regulator [Thermodesulfobacteriota bacterium]
MILAAARQVFATHPYNAASIRMVAAQGDFYHGLIRYHFPSKARIFEAVVEEACRSLCQANKEWLVEISTFPPEKALSTYLDRFIEYFQNQPAVLRIIVNNLSHENPAALPGYHHLAGFLADTRRDFETVFPDLFAGRDVSRFLSSLNALILHFLGAGGLEAQIMGFPSQSRDYLQWVKQTLVFVFLPVLEKTVRESSSTTETGK